LRLIARHHRIRQFNAPAARTAATETFYNALQFNFSPWTLPNPWVSNADYGERASDFFTFTNRSVSKKKIVTLMVLPYQFE